MMISPYLDGRAALLADLRRVTSGRRSDLYIDCREVLLRGYMAKVAGELIYLLLDANFPRTVNVVAGLALGACPLVTATAIAASTVVPGSSMDCLYVRQEAKAHGLKRLVEGPTLPPGSDVVVLDDVFTTGGSLRKTIQVLQDERQAHVVGVIVLVDRCEPGVVWTGPSFYSVFKRQDLIS